MSAKNNTDDESSRVRSLIEIWSMRPAPNTPEGDAWEAGCEQGYKWGFEAGGNTQFKTAKEQYEELMADDTGLSVIERLRFFCSLAMNGQDWQDVEPLFNELSEVLLRK